MAVAALVVAIIALFIAAASAIYARTQAIAAKGSLAIERARHKGERAPRFEPAIASDGGSLVLHLRLLPGQPPMAGVRATIVQAIGVGFDTSRRAGDGSRIDSWHTATWDGLLAQGSRATWPLQVSRPGNSGEVVLEVSDLADETRVAAITVKVPPDLTQTIW
jgi:hypothetical protein